MIYMQQNIGEIGPVYVELGIKGYSFTLWLDPLFHVQPSAACNLFKVSHVIAWIKHDIVVGL